MTQRRSIAVGLLVALAAVVFGCLFIFIRGFEGPPLNPPTPALLVGARSGGTDEGGCPSNKHAQIVPPIEQEGSREINSRLRNKFAPGSSADSLTRELVLEGFQLIGPCKDDPAVRSARFTQSGGGIAIFPAQAIIYWKVDSMNEIVWAKGGIWYAGL